MARPQTDIEAGRVQLLEVVEHMVAKRGAVTLTLADVAAEAGMSTANIYRFFANKEALFEAVAERWFAPKIRIMEEVVASDLPARDKLFQFFARRFQLMMANYREDPALFASYMALGHEHEDIIRGYVDLGDHYLAMIVADAMDEGYFDGLTVDRAVSMINLMVMCFINPEIMMDLQHSVTEDKLEAIVDAILAGLKAQAVAAPEKRLAAV
jgi:TetR/AcrR family transcriptional regulator, repressor of the ameABC operon